VTAGAIIGCVKTRARPLVFAGFDAGAAKPRREKPSRDNSGRRSRVKKSDSREARTDGSSHRNTGSGGYLGLSGFHPDRSNVADDRQ
jgi:hypothetical protein